VIRPLNVKKSIEAIRKALDFKGVSVVISKHLCPLFANSFRKSTAKPFYVSDRCRNHRNCVNDLACPAFFISEGRVKINPALCTGCSLCAQVCPENAILPQKADP
jgi:indolepyruvate ferredoxin oxidoreductase alpha subunit